MEMKHRQQHILSRGSNQGFTMVELMVAMVVSLLALAAIYSTFLAQHRSYQVQGQAADMQQNIRAAMYYMQREIRMAGSNPFKSLPLSSFGIIAACQNSINITEDLRGLATGSSPDGDVGDPDENIIYSLDANRNLIRTTGGVLIGCVPNGGNSQIIVQNIDALDFVYLDGNGAVTANIPDMRSVQITIVARTNDPLLYGTTNNITYQNQQGTPIFGPAGDNVSRRRLTTVIHCRNLSL